MYLCGPECKVSVVLVTGPTITEIYAIKQCLQKFLNKCMHRYTYVYAAISAQRMK